MNIRTILRKIGLEFRSNYDTLNKQFNEVIADNQRILSRLNDLAKRNSDMFPIVYPNDMKISSMKEYKTIQLDSMHLRMQLDPYMVMQLEYDDEYKEYLHRHLSYKWADGVKLMLDKIASSK